MVLALAMSSPHALNRWKTGESVLDTGTDALTADMYRDLCDHGNADSIATSPIFIWQPFLSWYLGTTAISPIVMAYSVTEPPQGEGRQEEPLAFTAC